VFSNVFAGKREEAAARGLYESIVAQARAPEFFRDAAVPDSVDGRFESLILHMFLVLHRLKQDHARTADLGQTLFDLMFFDMDQSIRVSGVGDLSVGPRIKAMGQAFYGHIAAYEAALAGGEGSLPETLARNLYGTVEAPRAAVLEAMAAYLRREVAALQALETESLLRGEVSFGPPPQLPAESD